MTVDGHRVDLVEAAVVALAEALVPSKMLLPPARDELLEDPCRVSRIAP